MSTPQQDIGNAIATVMGASPFTDHIGAVGYGMLKSDVGRDANGTALIKPGDAETLNGYTDSMKVKYTYTIEIDLANRAPDVPYTDIQRDIRNIFQPASRTLEGSFTNTSTKVTSATLACDSELIFAAVDANGHDRAYEFEVTVTVWESI
jgi:hypothetical protein